MSSKQGCSCKLTFITAIPLANNDFWSGIVARSAEIELWSNRRFFLFVIQEHFLLGSPLFCLGLDRFVREIHLQSRTDAQHVQASKRNIRKKNSESLPRCRRISAGSSRFPNHAGVEQLRRFSPHTVRRTRKLMLLPG